MRKILSLSITFVHRKEIMEETLKIILVKNEWFTTKQNVEDFFKQKAPKVIKCINECTSPEKDKLFDAFEGLKPQDVKVLIIGQDPYPTEGRADGLAFSFGNNEKAQDSLKNIFERLEELGIKNKNTKLTKWKKNGILLLN